MNTTAEGKADHSQPVVSIVIPAYNAESYLEATLRSVLQQTFRDFEVIVVDDGSEDGTADVAAAFDKVRYYHKPNGGSASARNLGIEKARGTYIAFLDADDRWKDDKLEKVMAHLQDNRERNWCYSDSLQVDATTNEVMFRKSQVRDRPAGWIFKELLYGNFVAPSTVIIKRDVFDKAGVFDESSLHRISEDWDLWLRIAERYPIGYIDEPLVITWHHGERKTETMDLERAFESRGSIISRAMKRRPDLPEKVKHAAWARLHVSMGRKWLQREKREEAQRHFLQAVFLQRDLAEAWLFLAASFMPRPLLRLFGQLRQLLRDAEQMVSRW